MAESLDLGRLPPAEQPRVLRVRVLSRRVRIAFWGLIGFFLVGAAIMVPLALLSVDGFNGGWREGTYDFSGARVDFRLVTGWRQLPFSVLTTVPVAIGLAVIWQLDRLLAAYQKGVILTAGNARRIRCVGVLLMSWCAVEAGIGVLARLLLGILQLRYAVERDAFVIHLEWFLAGFIVLIVGHAMRAASEVAEEAALTV